MCILLSRTSFQLQWTYELWAHIMKFTLVKHYLTIKTPWKKTFSCCHTTHAQSALLTAQRRLSPQRGDRCLSRRAKATKLRPVCCVPWERAREHVCARVCVRVQFLVIFHIKDFYSTDDVKVYRQSQLWLFHSISRPEEIA